jgi:hypothetical protein
MRKPQVVSRLCGFCNNTDMTHGYYTTLINNNGEVR